MHLIIIEKYVEPFRKVYFNMALMNLRYFLLHPPQEDKPKLQ